MFVCKIRLNIDAEFYLKKKNLEKNLLRCKKNLSDQKEKKNVSRLIWNVRGGYDRLFFFLCGRSIMRHFSFIQ